jgi:alpha-tubulin suppressor-like RCC1 family protein
MSGKWPGGFIKKTAPTVVGPVNGEGGSASGIWTLDQAADYESRGLWPKPVLNVEIYAWGYNYNGQLGDGSTVSKSSPVQVGSLTTWSVIEGAQPYGVHAFAIKKDGTMWSWGLNNYGQLGQGDTTQRNSPVQVGALTTWSTVAGSSYAGASIKTDGTLWTWGENANGTLGLSNTTSGIYSPVQVGALTNWSKIVMGGYHCASVKTDGTMWSWGLNNYGQLGQGNLTNYSSPVQVGALTNWLQASAGYRHTLAIKTDGTLWGWGYNNYGQLGQGNQTNYSSPVQVGALTTWLQVAGGLYTAIAVKTDGTLWTWGYNGQGGLGQGNLTNYSSPVQVGALTTWLQVASGYQNVLAVKTDGTLWGWGFNTRGQLGDGTVINRSSPVQIGALTTWKSVSCAQNSGYGKTQS